MDSVADCRSMYLNFGFNISEQVAAIMFGTVHYKADYKYPADLEIREITVSTFDDIRPNDIDLSTIDRSDHLPRYIFSPRAKVLGAFDKGQCVGYCGLRMIEEGCFKIQPLYGDSPSIATALIQSFLNRGWLSVGSKVHIYALLQNQQRIDSTIHQIRFDKENVSFRYRLHSKHEKKFAWENIYGITNALNTII